MTRQLAIVGLLLLTRLASAQVVISEKTNNNFGGYYVTVEKTRANLSVEWRNKISIADVMNLQKVMRNCLQQKSQSFFRIKQQPFLESCTTLAKNETRQTLPLRKNSTPAGLVVVFDMDETLLTQWNKVSIDNPERTTFIVRDRDLTLNESEGLMLLAPKGVTIRPGSKMLLHKLTSHPAISQIYFFTAREDRSAEELTKYFLTVVPNLKTKFKGLLARNSLRLDEELTTPSKDLRIISADLKRIVLIDDNPGRVMQKELNFWIPKFNADLFLDAVVSRDQEVLQANAVVMPAVYSIVTHVATSSNPTSAFYPYSNKFADENKVDWGAKILKASGFADEAIARLHEMKIFHQEWFPAETVKP